MVAQDEGIPKQAQAVTGTVRGLFGAALVGVYLHGSMVSGGLRPDSDLDLMLVISQPMPETIRQALLAELLVLSARYPAREGEKRCLEVMVMLASELAAPAYPARCEFMYGEWLRAGFEAGQLPMPFADPVVTLLLAQARPEARPLQGPALASLLADIPPSELHQALRDSLPALVNDLVGDERNVLLTLARMWRTASEGDFVAKDVAARWAASRMPADVAAPLLTAARAYRGELKDDWGDREGEVRRTADALQAQLRRVLGA